MSDLAPEIAGENAPDQSGLDIGARLRAVRIANGLSQRELARMAGVTNGLISQVENNRTSPSVSTLKRILDAVPITLAEFFVEPGNESAKIFYRADELRELNPAKVFALPPQAQNSVSLRQVGRGGTHSLQMLHERYAPGADTGEELYSHEAEEAGIVVSGRIEVTVGIHSATLGPGDAYIFDSTLPHRFRNTGEEECTIISACTPPSF